MPTVLMTGGHSGLGFVGAQALAKRYGCDLILAGRNRERVEKSARTQLFPEVVDMPLPNSAWSCTLMSCTVACAKQKSKLFR